MTYLQGRTWARATRRLKDIAQITHNVTHPVERYLSYFCIIPTAMNVPFSSFYPVSLSRGIVYEFFRFVGGPMTDVREANVDVIPTHIFRMHQEYAGTVRSYIIRKSLITSTVCKEKLLRPLH